MLLPDDVNNTVDIMNETLRFRFSLKVLAIYLNVKLSKLFLNKMSFKSTFFTNPFKCS